MAALGKIWEVKTEPKIPIIGKAIKVLISIKNIGSTSGTLWVYAGFETEHGLDGIFNKVGVPPGKTFKWLTCNCGKFTGETINVDVKVGRGAKSNEPDDIYCTIIEDGKELHYSAGEDIPQTNFTLDTHIVGEGAIEVTPPFGPYAPGTEVKVFAVKQQGWNFNFWSGDLEGKKNPTKIIMDSDKKITAVYKKK